MPGSCTATIRRDFRDYTLERPVGDSVFDIYAKMYAFDPRPLNPKEEIVETNSAWRRETISVDTAYGEERLPIHVLLPKDPTPPYRTVVYFPQSGMIQLQASMPYTQPGEFDFLLAAGWAVVVPVLKGTAERECGHSTDYPDDTVFYRNWIIQLVQDMRRTVDYLSTRNDIEHQRLAYYGYSWGALLAPIVLALDDRFTTAVLLSGGFSQARSRPEVDPLHFAPRVQIPVLMLNGSSDYLFPVKDNQEPLFDLFGTPPEKKKHVILAVGGHRLPSGLSRGRVIQEILTWLGE